MKNIQLTIILILISIMMIAQNQHTIDSLYQKLHDNVNIVDPAVRSSDIVWERIDIPSNLSLRSFHVTNNNELLIGTSVTTNSGGIYKYEQNDHHWKSIGLNTNEIYFIGQNNNKNLIAGGYSRIYKHYNQDSTWNEKFDSNTSCYIYYGIDSLLFVGNSGIIRSDDDGENWELIKSLSGAEDAKAFTATTTDSIFVGTTKYIGDGGGVYLSTDAGITWNHIGLTDHFIASMGVDNNNQVYAGNDGHYYTFQGGLYKFNYNNANWDTLFYFPYISSIVFNSENHIFLGYSLSGIEYYGGVMHSEDNGNTWLIDTIGIGNQRVTDLQFNNQGYLYALVGYSDKNLYKTVLPVSTKQVYYDCLNKIEIYPNPSDTKIYINFNNIPKNKSNISIKIFAVCGSCIINKTVSCNQNFNTINVSSLKPGLYICQIIINNKILTSKFIKQ